MIGISSFLKKFILLDLKNENKIGSILLVIKNKTKIELKKTNISFSGNRLKIKASPTERNEIFMHKDEIENELKKENIHLEIS